VTLIKLKITEKDITHSKYLNILSILENNKHLKKLKEFMTKWNFSLFEKIKLYSFNI